MSEKISKKMSADDLMDILEEAISQNEIELFFSEVGEVFIKAESQGKSVTAKVEGEDFETFLRSYVFYKYDKARIASGAIQEIQKQLQIFPAVHKDVYRRICARENSVYYDMGRGDGKCLKITKDEIKMVKPKNVLFVRNSTFLPQVQPDLEAEPKDICHFVEKHFHFSHKAERILFSTFLIGCFFRKRICMPLVQLYGEKGSGKSQCSKHLLDIISPTSAGLIALPKRIDEVAICLSNDCVVAFDNVSWISAETSDLLCLNCTKGTFTRRKFFSDNARRTLELGSIVIFNGTHQCIGKSDLADRSIFIRLNRISQEDRLGDIQLQAEWKNDLPAFFGAVCRAVQGVLGDTQPVEKPSPIRLVDFYEIAVKAGRQLGYSEKQIYSAFEANNKTATEAIVEGDALLYVIESFMSLEENKDGVRMSVTDWFKELKIYALEECGIGRRAFPAQPNVLSRRMSENESNLNNLGIYYKKTKGKNAHFIEIWRE